MTYSLGECANSLVMNGIFGFAMIYYTKALGLDPRWAGFAMSLSVFWEAITEPVMGHISDNTRSKWGRRHPYMLIGGLLMALCSYLIWTVPNALRGQDWVVMGTSIPLVFFYLVVMNLLLRTGLTMFFIPYMALGFEICSDYQGRSKIQGYRQIFNMAANFAGPAMAWTIFFGGKGNDHATAVVSNYHHMGATFAIATAFFVVLVVLMTFRWREDTTQLPREGKSGWWQEFITDMKLILTDHNPRWVFVFIFVVCAGMVVVSSLQMYVYDDFMQFPAWQKSIAHGSTMIGMAIGAAISAGLAQRFDKKGAVLIGGSVSIVANLALAALFLTGVVKTDAIWVVGGASVPVALILFVLFHATYWLGNGIMLPISTAMMADVSEAHQIETGVNKDGGYSSVFSLAMRMAISFSLVLAGYCLSGIGFKVPKEGEPPVVQSAETIWQLGMVTFVIGSLICLIALLAIRKYPLTRETLESMRQGSISH